jgi:hypothetical protein
VLFVEPRFFLFFAIVLTAYWSLRSNNDRKLLLLGASYFFYGCWDWRFAGMLLAISVADYFFALRIYQTSSQRARKLFVTLSLAMNLSVLGFFKYFHFFAGSAVSVANSASASSRSNRSATPSTSIAAKSLPRPRCATTLRLPPFSRSWSPAPSSGPGTFFLNWKAAEPSPSTTSSRCSTSS